MDQKFPQLYEHKLATQLVYCKITQIHANTTQMKLVSFPTISFSLVSSDYLKIFIDCKR